ncbi:hypothetical protein [Nonomuraea bangladeshensis]|uniref:hypothetical protein n=1 Tax=Nonomuraea bangladeshensis TaxID=404385 RepID=UPI0031E0ABD7
MAAIEIKPPLKDWTAPKWSEVIDRYPDHVAVKKDGNWVGFQDAWDDEVPPPRSTFSMGFGYMLLPRKHLQGFLARLGENARRVTVREIRVENHPEAFDAMLAEAGVEVKPPYARYVKGNRRRFLDENGQHHPSYILVKVTKGPMWWSLDDRARELIGDDDMVAWTQEGDYRKVRSGCVRRLIEQFEPLDRLEFRRLPDPPA